jgi:cation transport regulator ChaB
LIYYQEIYEFLQSIKIKKQLKRDMRNIIQALFDLAQAKYKKSQSSNNAF